MLQGHVLNDVAYKAKIGGGTISGIDEVNLLAPGAIAIFTDSNVMVDITSPAGELVDVKSVFFAVGKKDGSGAQLTQHIVRNKLIDYSAVSYAAPAYERQFVGNDGSAGSLNLPTLASGDESEIVVFDESKGGIQYQAGGRKAYRYSVTLGATATAAALIPALVARINEDEERIVDAVVVGSNVGIQLTAREYGVTFKLGVSGSIEDATITSGGDSNSVAFNPGKGTATEVYNVLDIIQGEFGRTHGGYLADKFWKYQTNWSSTGTYDTYLYKFGKDSFNGTGVSGTTVNELIFWVPAGPATFPQTAFQTTMGVIFGTDTSDATESGDDTA